MNISGIFLFLLFLAADRLYTGTGRSWQIRIAAGVLVCALALNNTATLRDKWYMAKSIFKSRSLHAVPDFDKHLESIGPYVDSAFNNKLVVISDIDPYINYKLRLPQHGFFSPFVASVRIDSTVAWFRRTQSAGMSLILFPTARMNLREDLLSINGHPSLGTDSVKLYDLPAALTLIRVE
jgi:hypothetical protein